MRASESYETDPLNQIGRHGLSCQYHSAVFVFPPSAVLPFHPFESSRYYRDSKVGMTCDERYLEKTFVS